MIPSRVDDLYTCWWEGGALSCGIPTMEDIRENVQNSLQTLRQDHKRSLNPTPYKVYDGPFCFRGKRFHNKFEREKAGKRL